MLAFSRNLYDELIIKLDSMDTGLSGCSIQQRLILIGETLSRLRKEMKSQEFVSDVEEIEFFKDCLPKFLSQSMYYHYKLEMEPIQQTGTEKLKLEAAEKLQRKMDEFICDNAAFVRYYQGGDTHLDRYYFLRSGASTADRTDLLYTLMDSDFFTIYTIKVATILACKRLVQEFSAKSSEVIVHANTTWSGKAPKWTDSKSGLTELVYALKKRGSFDNGHASVKLLTTYFEHVFDVKLGNVTSNFQEILSRKTGYTIFLDKLKDGLNEHIDQIEERHMR